MACIGGCHPKHFPSKLNPSTICNPLVPPLLQASTIKKHITTLAELAPFVNSKFCPNHGTTLSKAQMDALDTWYTNTISKLQAQVTKDNHKGNSTTSSSPLTLTQVWMATKAEFEALYEMVRVGCMLMVWCHFIASQLNDISPSITFHPCGPASLGTGGEVWLDQEPGAQAPRLVP